MKRPRGNKTSRAERAKRQARELEMMNDGKNRNEIAGELGISRQTFWRDLQALEARYVSGSAEDIRHFKEAQYRALMKIEAATAQGAIPPEVANTLVRVRDSVARLLGLNAENRSVVLHANADVDPDKLVGYRKFVYETRFIGRSETDKWGRIWALCRELNTPPAPEVINPPEHSELWDEPRQLTEGETANEIS